MSSQPPETAKRGLSGLLLKPGIRLGLFYAALFAVIGINVPFWPVWLASRGLDPSEIGIVVSAGLAMKVIANPLIGHVADRSGHRRSLMIALGFGAVVAYGSFWFAHSFLALVLVAMLYFILWSPLIPLGENMTMMMDKDRDLDYGRVRLWGSLGFIAASIGAGLVLTGRDPDLIYMMVTGAIALTAISCITLPTSTPDRAETHRWTVGQVLGNRFFVAFLICASLILASHSAYFAFATLHWKALGHSELVIGLLWGIGVIAEIILFIYARRLLSRMGALGMLLTGAAAGVVRWAMMPLDMPLAGLFFLQVLHAFTFGSAHLGAMYFISDHIEQKFSATAQGLYSSAVMGIALSLATLLSGYLYERYGALVFLAMAVMCLAGFVLCLLMIRDRRTKE